MIWNTIATNRVTAGTMDRDVHSPGASRAQNRRKPSEKPSKTVMAVIIPCRYPSGRGFLSAGGFSGVLVLLGSGIARSPFKIHSCGLCGRRRNQPLSLARRVHGAAMVLPANYAPVISF